MAGGEVTPTVIQHFNIPTTVDSGATERRLVQVYADVTSDATTATVDLSTYVTGLSAITNINEALDGAQNGGTANTWSGTTVTFAGHSGSGVWKLKVLGYY